jgi:antitoxin component YwqK of YwqJK toxin-antitoxin module
MTKKPETVKEEDLNRRKDGLYYKKYAKVPFTGTMKVFHAVDPDDQHRLNDQLWKNINYKNGKQEGRYESFWFNGQLGFRGNIKNGNFEGPCESLDLSGKLVFKSNKKHGYHDGMFETIRSRGVYIPLEKIEKKEIVLKIERDFNLMLSYLKNKKIPRTNCIGFFALWIRRISVKDGVWEYFDENGKCQTRVNFKNGKRVK